MAKRLIDMLEDVTEAVHNAYFVDLFVRVSNAAAITMYNKVVYFCIIVYTMHIVRGVLRKQDIGNS